jgi:translation initiation factor 2B subunit (eIF-2B alpha/beta/delta family)
MTEQEMLKEALEWQEHIRKLITATDDELYHKRSKVFDWLIKQAERVEELEKKLSINTNNMKQLQKQNVRYKQALEYIQRAIYTQHCTKNHKWNSEFEKGQISGLIQASNIVDKAIRKVEGEA